MATAHPDVVLTRSQPVGAPTRLAALDCSRLAAALSVLAYHWFSWGPRYGVIEAPPATLLASVAAYGYLGVELFFLISGFVIFMSASGRDAASFAAGRATRLYPAFWAGLLLTTATLLLTGQVQAHTILPPFLANLTMVPAAFGHAPLDGVYWTLTLELQFYALVFVFLLLGLRRWLRPFFSLWAIGMLLTNLLAPDLATFPLLGGLFSLFAGGAIIAAISRAGWTPLNAIGLAASVASSVLVVTRQAMTLENQGSTEPVIVAVIVVALYILVYCLTRPSVANLRIPGSKTAGALTYPIYLCHAVLGYALINALGAPPSWTTYAVAFAIVLAVAAFVHFVVERAAAPLWRRLFSTILAKPIHAAVQRTSTLAGQLRTLKRRLLGL